MLSADSSAAAFTAIQTTSNCSSSRSATRTVPQSPRTARSERSGTRGGDPSGQARTSRVTG